jgi:uroporphyrinogen-III decarboxylase
MNVSRDTMMAAIGGSCQRPPVVIPYLQYYFPNVVDQLTSFTREDFLTGCSELKVEALLQLHAYFDCDWVRVTTDPVWLPELYGREVLQDPTPTLSAEELWERGVFDVAKAIIQELGQEKFIYGRVGLPYGALFGDFTDIASVMIALKREPDRCKHIMEASIPQRLEEIKAWAEAGVDALWLGQWLCSADLISEANYLEFVYPYDHIVIDAVHDAGLLSIHHFCGDAIPRLQYLKTLQPKIFGVEESKKGFDVDIGQVRTGMGPEICLLGNVDVYGVLERGSPASWQQEVARQVTAAGPGRFIVSCGSPVTPDTPPQQLAEFVKTAREVCGTFAGVEDYAHPLDRVA